MGNLGTFPILCLYNYVCFRWFLRRPVPVKVNGDDIVFRATREEARRWMDGVSHLGLRLSVGKTLVSSSVFSLNSTFFRATSHRVKLVPVIRWAVLVRPADSPHGLGSGLRTFREGFVGEAKVRLDVVYLTARKQAFLACGRSVMRDLRCPAEPEALRRVGWMKREAFFLSLPVCPLPCDTVRLGVPSLPAGWRRFPLSQSPEIRRRQLDAEKSFYSLLTSQAWEGPTRTSRELSSDLWKRTKLSGHSRAWRSWSQSSRLRGRVSIFKCRTYRLFATHLRLSTTPVWEWVPPKREKMVWCGGVSSGGATSWVRGESLGSPDFVRCSCDGHLTLPGCFCTGPTRKFSV